MAIPTASLFAQETPGIPWTGAPGITETISEIMERDRRALPAPAGEARETKPRRSLRGLRREDNPLAPAVPQWPPSSNPPVSSEPASPQPVGTSFLGAQASESGLIPPDSMGAVGPTQVLVTVNGRIKVFDKSGNVGALNTTTDIFFNSVRSAGTSDPNARYDRLSGRWFVTMVDVAAVNRILIAVSSGSTITNTSSFTFFQFRHDQVGTTPNADTGDFADYDSLGVDQNALYIGINVFDQTDPYPTGTTGFVINKANLLAGSLTVTPFRQLVTCNPVQGTCGTGPLSPRGVDNDDPGATEGYFIGVDGASFSLLDIRRVSNPGGSPSISGTPTLTVPTTRYPINQSALGSIRPLDSLDDRLFAAAVHKNKTTGAASLWTAHNIEVNSSGVGTIGGGRNGSRWYEIANLTGSPALNQSGTLFDSASSNPVGFWIPSVAMSGQGHVALGSSRAGNNNRAEIAVAGRLSGDALGTIQAPTLAQSSSTSYNVQNVTPQRWGDYSIVVVDPSDDMTMWTFQEYCNSTNSWGVRVIQLQAPPPATPASASPPTIGQGTSGSVVVTGASVNGSGFFDPGAGFANHISATVNGGGITVNSVAFTDPTHVTLNISVAGGAAMGPRTITVTNPDGQSMTSAAGILTVTGSSSQVTVNSITPNSGPTSGGTSVAITGSNFVSGATVTIGGVSATGVVFVDSGTLTAVTGAHSSGTVDVVVTNPSSESGTLIDGYTYGGDNFFTVTPCRVIDTRRPVGPLEGPALVSNMNRAFAVAGQCNIPPGVRSVSVNVTVTNATGDGFLTLYPNGAPQPATSTINFRAGQTRANNAVLGLGPSGDFVVFCGQTSTPFTVDFILDVTGYFQ